MVDFALAWSVLFDFTPPDFSSHFRLSCIYVINYPTFWNIVNGNTAISFCINSNRTISFSLLSMAWLGAGKFLFYAECVLSNKKRDFCIVPNSHTHTPPSSPTHQNPKQVQRIWIVILISHGTYNRALSTTFNDQKITTASKYAMIMLVRSPQHSYLAIVQSLPRFSTLRMHSITNIYVCTKEYCAHFDSSSRKSHPTQK